MTMLALIIAYLLGSIPFGLILTRWAGIDIRQVGSGNIGATNVMRTGNKKLGIATLLLDAAKGYLAVWIGMQMEVSLQEIYLLALIAVLGHVFPVWLKFKGGKGVATAFGVAFALDPGIGLLAGLFWITGFFAMRYVSVASIGCFWVAALFSYLGDSPVYWFYLALSALITWAHRANLKRLKDGTENRFERK